MNHIIIGSIKDLSKILEGPIYLSGKSSLIDDETANNMWALTFDDSLIGRLEANDLEKFLSQLLQKYNLQLMHIDPSQSATFYLWFDKQALQLRFNIVSGSNVSLPFGCKINRVHSPEFILKDFISTTHEIAAHGETIEFLEPGEDLDDDNGQQEYTLDVYVEILNIVKSNSKN